MGRVLPFVACVLAASIANATVLVPAEFSEIVRGSEIIAYARIVDARPEWADGFRSQARDAVKPTTEPARDWPAMVTRLAQRLGNRRPHAVAGVAVRSR